MSTFIELMQGLGPLGWSALALVVVGVVSAPMLVRRSLRGEAVSPARWRSPGGELIMLCWLNCVYTGVGGVELLGYACGFRLGMARLVIELALHNAQLLSLVALVVTLWTTLCVAIGARLTPIPTAAATLRDGLKVCLLLSLVILCQLAAFVSLSGLMALILEDSVTRAAEDVWPLVRRLEWALGASVGAVVLAWRRLGGDRRGLWQIGALTAGLIAWSVSVAQALYAETRWSRWRSALDLPYSVPQRPLGALSHPGEDDGVLCTQIGERWRCEGRHGVEEDAIFLSGATLAVTPDTPLGEVIRETEGDLTPGVGLLVCSGSPRASTWGVARWFPPDLATCTEVSLRVVDPDETPHPSFLVISASRDWTVQRAVDEVARAGPPRHAGALIRWAEAPE